MQYPTPLTRKQYLQKVWIAAVADAAKRLTDLFGYKSGHSIPEHVAMCKTSLESGLQQWKYARKEYQQVVASDAKTEEYLYKYNVWLEQIEAATDAILRTGLVEGLQEGDTVEDYIRRSLNELDAAYNRWQIACTECEKAFQD